MAASSSCATSTCGLVPTRLFWTLHALWKRPAADGMPLEALPHRITGELLLAERYKVLADTASELC